VRRVLIGASLVAAFVSVPLAGQSRYLADAPGRWKPWMFNAYADDRRARGAGPAEVKEVEAQLLRLQAIIKNTPGITNPIGFSVVTAGTFGNEGRFEARAGEPALTVRPLAASLDFVALPITEFGSGATAKRDDSGEAHGLLFFVNQLTQPLSDGLQTGVPEFEKLDVDVVRLAPPQPDVLGFSRYGDTLVIKKNAAPIWVAVSFGETLDLVARGIDQRLTEERDALARIQKSYDDAKDPKKREERLAQYKKMAPQVKDPAYLEKMTKAEDEMARRADKEFPYQLAAVKVNVTKSEEQLASVKATAAGLSAADKAAPGCYASRDTVPVSRFHRAPSPGCEPLVRANWKFFNPALPRSTPQVLTISHFVPCLLPELQKVHVGGCRANVRLLEAIDKAALLAWLQ